jgi:hypothetical protein
VIAIFCSAVLSCIFEETYLVFLKLPMEVATNFREAPAKASMHEPGHAMDELTHGFELFH